MTATYIRPLAFPPGIDRDGTLLSRTACTDGEWVRWYLGKPRKIGGYQLIIDGNDTIIRTLASTRSPETSVIGRTGIIRLFAGQYNGITVSDINYNAKFSTNNVTPATDKTADGYFLVNQNNLWQFTTMKVAASNDPANPAVTDRIEMEYVFGFVGQNANDAGSLYEPETTEKNGCMFYSLQTDGPPAVFLPMFVTTPLLPSVLETSGGVQPPPTSPPTTGVKPSFSGGVVVVGPFLFFYGSSILWSTPGNPFQFPVNQIYFPLAKVILGKQVRGAGVPTAIFWTEKSVIIATSDTVSTPVQTTESSPVQKFIDKYEFNFDVQREEVSLISSLAAVQFNDCFYWIGNNQFYVFNGTVQIIKNEMNRMYFFNGLNLAHSSKVWGVANPLHNEITWYYPRGENTECSHSITYNVAGDFWYDSESSRSCGLSSPLFMFPIMADSGINAKAQYPQYGIWRHESGENAVYSSALGDSYPIKSSFTTPVMMLGMENPENDVQILVRRIEPDFRLTGNYEYENQTLVEEEEAVLNPMEFQILTKSYAHARLKVAKSLLFDNFTTYLNVVGAQGRQVQFKFISDSLDGSYQMGLPIITFSAGDVRSG